MTNSGSFSSGSEWTSVVDEGVPPVWSSLVLSPSSTRWSVVAARIADEENTTDLIFLGQQVRCK